MSKSAAVRLNSTEPRLFNEWASVIFISISLEEATATLTYSNSIALNMLYFDLISKQLQTFLLWNTKPETEKMTQDFRGKLPVPLMMTISQDDKRSLTMDELAQNLIPDVVFADEQNLKVKAVR